MLFISMCLLKGIVKKFWGKELDLNIDTSLMSVQ